MEHAIEFGTVSWIDPEYIPPVNAALITQTVTNAWVVKTMMGLAATANYAPPPPELKRVADYQRTKAYRALTSGRVILTTDPGTKKVTKPVSGGVFAVDPGFTPPFSLKKFPSGTFVARLPWDKSFHPGQLSPISGVYIGRKHPHGTLASGTGEQVLAHTLIKFRAGKETDDVGVGIMVGAPYHVPWVWCESLLTYTAGRVRMRAVGSEFPSHAWYLGGRRRVHHAQVGDKEIAGRLEVLPDITGGPAHIVFHCEPEKMNLYRVLKKGVKTPHQTPLTSEGQHAEGTSVTSHPNVVDTGTTSTIDIPLESLGDGAKKSR